MGERSLTQVLTQLLALFPNQDTKLEFKMTIGFDGFIDQIIELVDKRFSCVEYRPIETITAFGERILRSANLSTNLELVPKIAKIGGNGPIMANALLAMEQKVFYIGALGHPEINPVFQDLATRSEKTFSLANPAQTDALEFNDGKIMLGKLAPLTDLTWENIIKQINYQDLKWLFTKTDLIAMVNWTMIPYMNQIWENLSGFLAAQTIEQKPILFIDLADPEKRSVIDIQLALKHIQRFTRYYRVVLGLNRKEANELGEILQLNFKDDIDHVSITEITKALSKKLDLWCVMVHSIRDGAAVCKEKFSYLMGPYCPKPKLTTGAGDNFNAGFCLGLLLELPLDCVLGLAKACSGFYVRNGFSPNLHQLQEFIVLWISNIDNEF